jgi:hypothetical protein
MSNFADPKRASHFLLREAGCNKLFPGVNHQKQDPEMNGLPAIKWWFKDK